MDELFTLSNLIYLCAIIGAFTGATASIKSSVKKTILRAMEDWTSQLKNQQADIEVHKKTLHLLLRADKSLIRFLRKIPESVRNGYTGAEISFEPLDAIEAEIDAFTAEVAMKGKSYL